MARQIVNMEDSSYYFAQEGVLTKLISLECDSTGCEMVGD